jgi:hypothetical protein
MIDIPDPALTLGEQLDAQARMQIARAAHAFAWTAAFTVLAAHLTRLADVSDGRFDRVESAPGRPGPTARVIARAAWPSAQPGGERQPAGGMRPGVVTQPAAVTRPGPVTRPATVTQSAGELAPAASGRPAAWPEPQPQATDDEAPPRVPEAPVRPIPADVRRRIREVAGPGADLMRAHDDGQADAIARAHGADAVTFGHDVYFRQGRFAPDDRRGAALLAHEASHVSAHLSALLGRSTARRRPDGAAEEEEEEEEEEEAFAIGLEHRLLARPQAPAPPAQSPPMSASVAPAPFAPGRSGWEAQADPVAYTPALPVREPAAPPSASGSALPMREIPADPGASASVLPARGVTAYPAPSAAAPSVRAVTADSAAFVPARHNPVRYGPATHGLATHGPATRSLATHSPATHSPASAAPPMRAATDRDTGTGAASAPDLEALRQSLMTELMSRLRTEFERGG